MEAKIAAILFTATLVAIFNSSTAQTAYQNEGLNAHNSLRPRHGSPAMHLDGGLNQAAQDCAVYYAKKKTIDHSCGTSGAGENLYATWGGSGNPNLQETVKNAVNAWYGEHVTYNYENPGASTGVTGHFTQVVWKASNTLGIGAATVDGYTAVVGKYKPQGNIILGGSGVDKWKFYKENVRRP